MTKKTIYISILLIIFLSGTVAYFSLRLEKILEKQKAAWETLEEEIRKELNAFNGEAGIVIRDLNTGWTIKINQDKILPSASLVKIPIMLAAFYAADEGRVRLEDTLTLKSIHKALGSGRLKDAPQGTQFSLRQLIELMILESDNTATNMLIDHLGLDYLNNCFKKLGLKNTNIVRKMMDFSQRQEGKDNFTTALDLANILEKIYKNKLINKTYSQMCLDFLKKQKIKDRIPANLPADTLVAHKTGLEKGICHDAGIVFTGQGDFLICVLTKHRNKTAKAAKEFIAQIAFLAYKYKTVNI